MPSARTHCPHGVYIATIDRMLCRRGSTEFYTNCHLDGRHCYHDFEELTKPVRTAREAREDAS